MAKGSPFIRAIERVASGTTLVPREQALSFDPASFDVTDDPTGLYADSAGASVEGASVVSLKSSLAVSSYVRPTSSGPSSGLSVGRWDLGASNPYAAIPGTFAIGNDDGSDFSFQVDNGSSLITSNLDLTVAGTTTLAATTVEGILSTTVIQGTGVTAQTAPGVNESRVWFDQGSSLWKFINHGGSATAFATATDLASYVPTTRTVSTTSPLSGGGALSSNLTLSLGTVGMGNGGLGFTTATQGDIFYASGANTPAKLAVGGANTVLVGGGATPAYSATPTVTSLTTTSLTVNGKGVVGPNVRSVTHSDSPVTAADGDVITMDATAGTISVTVPVAAGAKVELKRKLTDTSANAITLSPASGTIEGGATLPFSTTAGMALTIRGDGTNAGIW